jgi:hypothetical protein
MLTAKQKDLFKLLELTDQDEKRQSLITRGRYFYL